MTWSPDSSITGGAQTGFTSPTFTTADTVAPALNAKSKVVTAVSGVGSAGANSISSPVSATLFLPAAPKALPVANPITGLRGSIPNNQTKLVVRYGGEAASGVPATAIFRGTWDIPAGMDSFDPDTVRALTSLVIGLLSEESADLGDTLVQGSM